MLIEDENVDNKSACLKPATLLPSTEYSNIFGLYTSTHNQKTPIT